MVCCVNLRQILENYLTFSSALFPKVKKLPQMKQLIEPTVQQILGISFLI